ncbi:hypothetical protein BH20ACT23_BH20ACT23_09010 [soil metagenome]
MKHASREWGGTRPCLRKRAAICFRNVTRVTPGSAVSWRNGVMDDRERFKQAHEAEERKNLRRRRREHREWINRTRGVGYLICRARMYARLSQAKLAEYLGTTQSTISRWECGHQLPSLLTMERIALVTGLQVEIAFESRDQSGDFVCAAVLRDEGNLTELEILKDFSREELTWPPGWRPPSRVDTFRGRPSGDGW